MLQLAQDMYKRLQERVRTTLRVMVDLAESVGVPPSVTSLIPGLQRDEDAASAFGGNDRSPETYSWSQPPATAPHSTQEAKQANSAAEPGPAPAVEKPRSSRKRGLAGGGEASKVRPLKVEDALDGSTYLARIVWSLGVSALEGTGPLRPADMARMIMSRSPVSLEPPNVARYIRRSKPSCIEVDHSEGSSHFYRLNDEGQTLFQEKFGLNGK